MGNIGRQPGHLVTIDQFIRKKTTQSSKPTVSLSVYCDGSTFNNGKKYASGGYGVYFGPDDPRNVSEPFLIGIPTNQKTEIYAMTRTLQILDGMVQHQKLDCHFDIYTDSEYVINCLEKWIPTWIKKDWIKADGHAVKNIDLLKEMSTYYYRHPRMYRLHHVKSHTGAKTVHCIGNDHADRLAVAGTHQHPNCKKRP
jgi:ribonuclease HI